VYNFQGRPDTSLILNLRAVEIARKLGDPERLGACLTNVGATYHYLEKYDSAMQYYLRAIGILDQIGLPYKSALIYANLAGMCNEIENYDKANEYFEKAMTRARESGNESVLLTALNNGSMALINLERYEEAIKHLQEGIAIARRTHNDFVLTSMLTNLGDAFLKMLRFREAKPIFEEGLSLAESINNIVVQVTTMRGLAYCNLHSGQYSLALDLALKANRLATEHALQIQTQKNFLLMADISLAAGNLDAYYLYSYKNDSISKIIDRNRIQRNLESLEQQYKAKEREQEIEKLEKEKAVQKLKYRTNQFVLILVAGIFFTTLIITLLLLRSNRQKRLILEQEKEIQIAKINKLEKEKQLLASEAILKGEEQERHRLAKDLHDGLGGLLSGIKYSFSHMKENLIMTPENQRSFERSMDMLDSSIRELRRVAHNLMPESLIKFGLAASINDICKDITASGALSVTFQSYDLDKLQTDQSVLLTIYRIIQELLNNILKHAGARAALVQLIYREHKLTITVEDDGHGFDTSMISRSTGIGLENIRSRINYLGGTLDIQSTPGKGSTFNIELNL